LERREEADQKIKLLGELKNELDTYRALSLDRKARASSDPDALYEAKRNSGT